MLNDLWQSFGILGLASIAAWAALGALLLWFLGRHRLLGVGGVVALAVLIGFALAAAGDLRGWVFAAAWVLLVGLAATYGLARRWDGVAVLGLAVLVLGGAWWNSTRVSAIVPLPSQAALAAAERARQARLGALTTHATSMRFAEDTEADRMDLAGVSAKRYQSIYEAAAAGDEQAPLYKQGGKVERDAGKRRSDDATRALAEAAEPDDADGPEPRKLPEAVVHRAQRYDRMNLFIARFGFLLAVGLVGLDYVRRLNRTGDALPPLPVAGPLLDAVSPKSRTVWWQREAPGAAEAYARRVVRRGEAFLLVEDEPTFTEPVTRLPRLEAFGRGTWWMPVHRVANEREPAWVLETLWFGRGSFVVRGAGDAAALRGALLEHLRGRHIPRAWARRTAHVIWRTPNPPGPATLDELAYLCREANLKLAVITAAPCPPAARGAFEEVSVA
jgi:hypothetical protein